MTMLTVSEYVAEYEFRSDEGDYTPTAAERGMIEDAIHGYLASQQATGEGENLIGAAEREVGQAVYERIEHLIGGDSPELAYLAELVASVEEYGSYSGPTVPLASQQAVSPPEGWRPIETAPKDGDDILACDDETGARCVTYWTGEHWQGRNGFRPTHWMPLQPAPSASQDRPHRNAADGGSSNEGVG